MATPNYYDMMDAENRRLQAEQAAALKSDEGLPVGITPTPSVVTKGGMRVPAEGPVPTEGLLPVAEIAAGELYPPLGMALDAKDMAKAVESRDPIAMAMAGVGFLPWLGGPLKALFKAIRGGDKSAETIAAAKKAMDEQKLVDQMAKYIDEGPTPRELSAQRTWKEGNKLVREGRIPKPTGEINPATGKEWSLEDWEEGSKLATPAKKRMIQGPSPHATMPEDEAMSVLDAVIGRDQNIHKQLWDYWNSAAYAQGSLPKIEGLDPKVAAAAQSFRPSLTHQLLLLNMLNK